MGPGSLIKNIPSGSQQWKAPVKAWIRDLRFAKFGDKEPQVPDEHKPVPTKNEPRPLVEPEATSDDESSEAFPFASFTENDDDVPF